MCQVEGVATAIICLLVAGLFQTKLTVVLGALYILGRALYAIGYVSTGPAGRLVGTLLLDVSLLASFLIAVRGAFVAGGGVQGAMDIVQSLVTLNIMQ